MTALPRPRTASMRPTGRDGNRRWQLPGRVRSRPRRERRRVGGCDGGRASGRAAGRRGQRGPGPSVVRGYDSRERWRRQLRRPLVDVVGVETDGYFGQAAAPVGDLDGDSAPDLFVFAGRENGPGVDVGGVYFAPGSGAAPTPLEYLGEPAGHEHGRAMTLFDITGDGIDDLVLGSPADVYAPNSGLYAGSTTAFSGVGKGVFSREGQALWGAGHRLRRL